MPDRTAYDLPRKVCTVTVTSGRFARFTSDTRIRDVERKAARAVPARQSDGATAHLPNASRWSPQVGSLEQCNAWIAAKPLDPLLTESVWWDVADLAAGCVRLSRLTPSSWTVWCGEWMFETGWHVLIQLPPASATGAVAGEGAVLTASSGDLVFPALIRAAVPLVRSLADPSYTDAADLAARLTSTLAVVGAHNEKSRTSLAMSSPYRAAAPAAPESVVSPDYLATVTDLAAHRRPGRPRRSAAVTARRRGRPPGPRRRL